MTSLWVNGQDSNKTIKLLPVPAFGFSPETKTYIGAVTLLTFDFYEDSLTRISNAKLEFNYTWNRQYIMETEWNYFLNKEKWFTRGRFHYSWYPDYYYGIGSLPFESNKILYNSNRIILEANVLKRIGGKFFLGPNIRYLNYYNVSYTGNLQYSELNNGATIGFSITLLKDTRNNLLTPEKGYYLNLNAGYNFSDKDYTETNLDFRFYKTLFDKITWANRLIGEFTFGNPPFYDYSFLGGDKYVRGYNYGRYRDNHLTSLQTEIRFPVFWRIGMAGFGGLSNLFGNNNFTILNSRPNAGMGLRFTIDKHDKTNLRLDYAVGNDKNSGFYISFGESF